MKINGPEAREVRDAYAGESVEAEKRKERSEAVAGEAGQPSDRVRISARARELQQLWDAAAGAPEVRTELVERVRSEIQNGRIRIDPERIAQALLSEFENLPEPRSAPTRSDEG